MNDSKKDLSFKEVYELFDMASALKRSQSRKVTMGVCNKFIRFIKSSGSDLGYTYPNRFLLESHLNPFISVQFKDYLLSLGILDKTAYGKLLQFNRVLKFGVDAKLIPDLGFVFANITYNDDDDGGRIRTYSDVEVGRVEEIIKQERVTINAILKNIPLYVKKGIGSCPITDRIINGTRAQGFASYENCVFYFENQLNCKPIISTLENKKLHGRFLTVVSTDHGGLVNFYRGLGVLGLYDYKICGVLLIELALVTGLNPCSLFSLRVDCLTECDPLTGQPSIVFEKLRSGGSRTYYISVDDDNVEIRDLKQKQYFRIKRIIDNILKLTSTFREQAEEEERDMLFIFQSTSRRSYGKVMVFRDARSFHLCKYLKEKHNLADENGHPIMLQLVKFRPTKINAMIMEGRDIGEIQVAAQHATLQQTANYMHRNNLEPKLVAEDNEILNKIYSSYQRNETSEIDSNQRKPEIVSGVFCDCKNILDPPAEVKKLKSYRKGQSCSWFNMCLFCKNIILTKHHLPVLINYYEQIKTSESYWKGELPNPHHYSRIFSILDSILDENRSGFSKEDLMEAKKIAELTRHEYIDPAIYVPSKL